MFSQQTNESAASIMCPQWRIGLIKWITEIIKYEAKEQKGGFLPMLVGTSAASILGNALVVRE